MYIVEYIKSWEDNVPNEMAMKISAMAIIESWWSLS